MKLDWEDGIDYASVELKVLVVGENQKCADCEEPAETYWLDSTPVCFPCAYNRAN